jgi:hypothetical protein
VLSSVCVSVYCSCAIQLGQGGDANRFAGWGRGSAFNKAEIPLQWKEKTIPKGNKYGLFIRLYLPYHVFISYLLSALFYKIKFEGKLSILVKLTVKQTNPLVIILNNRIIGLWLFTSSSEPKRDKVPTSYRLLDL